MNGLTHASFFSGVGGTDLGLERAGWRTVSFSEVDPYANAVLAERWPGVPNLGDITVLHPLAGHGGGDARLQDRHGGATDEAALAQHLDATLWSGGFPCQDLSVAGKRAGFAGERSVLAFAFLDLVRQHRPPTVLLENVPGLLSSNGGRDFGALLGTLGELRYGWAYRILDARFFGVPQRRRRVFILAFDLERGLTADGAAEVLSVGSRCDRHPPTGVQAGAGVADGTSVGAIPAGVHGFPDGVQEFMQGHFRVQRQTPDPGGVRAADGLAGRAHDRGGVVYTKSRRAQTDTDDETWVEGEVMPTLNSFDVGDVRTTAAIIGGEPQDDPLLPLGLDSHRYRCCGNGVVAPVAEWIGMRLAEVFA